MSLEWCHNTYQQCYEFCVNDIILSSFRLAQNDEKSVFEIPMLAVFEYLSENQILGSQYLHYFNLFLFIFEKSKEEENFFVQNNNIFSKLSFQGTFLIPWKIRYIQYILGLKSISISCNNNSREQRRRKNKRKKKNFNKI